MKRPSPTYPPVRFFRIPCHAIDDAILECTDSGAIAHLIRFDGGQFSIVKNSSTYLVRDRTNKPLGTVSTVQQALKLGQTFLNEIRSGDPRAAIDQLVREWERLDAERAWTAMRAMD